MGAEVYFASLSRKQSMLLLSAVTFGGQDCLASFDFLRPDEAEILKHRALELLQIPREKRIPLLVTEIKRLLSSQKSFLWAADPAKVAEVLKRERPIVTQVLLRAFPIALAEAVRLQLPPLQVRIKNGFQVRPDVLNLLRWKLAEVLERVNATRAHFKFSDLLRLQARELLTLCDQMGARVLAPALAGLPTQGRDAFLAALPPVQRQVAAKYAAATGVRKLAEREARQVLALHEAKGPAAALRSAGAQRIARACLAQSAEFAARLLEKYRGEFGALLAFWVRQERQNAGQRGDGGRSEIVGEMERLAGSGHIAKPVSLVPAAFKALASERPSLPKPPLPGAAPKRPSFPVPIQAVSRPLLGPPPKGRDWVAERVARRAGAASSRADPAEPHARTIDTDPFPKAAPEVAAPQAAANPQKPRGVDEATWVSSPKGSPRGSNGRSG